MKEMIRAGLSKALVRSGVTRLGRRLRSHDGTLILYGHRVADDDEGYLQGLPPAYLREQLEYLTSHYEVIPLDVLLDCVEARKPAPPRSVVLTFDDGFRDNVEVGLPMLDEFGVTATIFVVTRSLETGELPWSQRLGFLFQRTARDVVTHPALGDAPVPLTSPAERRRAYGGVKSSLVPLSRVERDAEIAELAHQLAVDPPADRMMTWAHARAAAAAGHGIGAHTYSHALLARVPPVEARKEMVRSLQDVRDRLGIDRPPFCFPAGSVDNRTVGFARELGFRSAFRPGQRRRLNHGTDDDAFALVRIGLINAPATHLEAELDGPFHRLRSLAGRYGT